MTPSDRVLIIGGKGTAINIAEQILQANEQFNYPMLIEGFCIDEPAIGENIAGFPVVCGVRQAWDKYKETNFKFLFALYRPDAMEQRTKLLEDLKIPAERFATFIHPTAYVSKTSKIGAGTVVLNNATVQHDVKIGRYNIVNSQVVIEHSAEIENSSFLAAGVCVGARARIRSGAFLGLNSIIREDIEIGAYSFVGMGSAVVKDVAPRTLVYGCPAKRKP
jgi:sugar O-acyltransferase (sialic acid O-acetyltransferase NeuD family)